MPSTIYLYEAPSLHPLPVGSSIDVIAIDRMLGRNLVVTPGGLIVSGFGATFTVTKPYDLLIDDRSGSLGSTCLKTLNGNMPNRIDLVMYPLATPTGYGTTRVHGYKSVHRYIQQQVKSHAWGQDEATGVANLYNMTLLMSTDSNWASQNRPRVSRWMEKLRSLGIDIEEDTISTEID